MCDNIFDLLQREKGIKTQPMFSTPLIEYSGGKMFISIL